MAAWARWPSASSQVPKRERLRLQVPIKRVILSYPTGTASEHMRVHPFIVVCRLDKRKRHLATTCDADNSRSNRARRSLRKHGIPLPPTCFGANAKDANPKATVAKCGRLVGSDSIAVHFPPILTRSRVGHRHDMVMAAGGCS